MTKWLLIFDNADDLSILQGFWPSTSSGSILLTSRDPLAKTRAHVPVTNGIDLDPFEPERAGTLLRNLTGYHSPADIASSEKIARKLSGLPLALVQIAGTIIRRDMSFDEFLGLYDTEALRPELYQAHEGTLAKTLYTVWQLEDLSTEAYSLLSIIAFLDPDQIAETVLNKMADLSEDERLTDYPVSLGAFIAARTELTRSSLVRRNRDRKELSIHHIIQDTMRSRMDEDATKNAFECVSNLMYKAWPFSEFEHSTKRIAACESVAAHVQNIHQLYDQSQLLRDAKQVQTKLARLFMDFGWYLYERGNMHESGPYFHSCEDICALKPKETWITRGDNQFCIAATASILNDPQSAILHAKQCVDIFQEHDPKGWRLCQAHNELCFAYIAAGRFEESLEQANLAIAGYFALPQPEYPDWAMVNKGFCLCSLGKYEEASKIMEGYLRYRRENFGPWEEDRESSKTGHGLVVLGKVRGCQDRLPESLDLLLKALTQYHRTIGSKHIKVGALYHNLGDTYAKLQKANEACSMYNEALRVYYGRPTHYSAQIVRTLLGLTKAQRTLGLHQAASENEVKADAILEKLSQVHKRKIVSQDIDELVPNWSK